MSAVGASASVDPRQVAVLLIGFNRPDKTRAVLKQLRLAQPQRVYFAVDGPRPGRRADAAACQEVRDLRHEIDWTDEVKTLFHDENLGCRDGVVTAIHWFFEHEPEGIILEDDCVPARDFVPFCAELLERYRDDPRVFMVSGSNWGLASTAADRPSYVFSRYSVIWGWATWRRAWREYDVEMSAWRAEADKDAFLGRFYRRRKERRFRRTMFDRVAAGDIDTWDYQWHHTLLRKDALCAVPTVNLVSNIGLGPDATHTRRQVSGANRFDIPVEALDLPLRHPPLVQADPSFDERVADDFRYRPRDVRNFVSFRARRALRSLRPAMLLGRLALHGGLDAYRHVRARYTVNRPTVINFSANDICNSGCTMCNIWKQKQDLEVSPADIRKGLSRRFFQRVRFVGITGGEPTLRRDLAEVYRAVIDAIPGVQALGMITNAIQTEQVIARIDEVAAVVRGAGKSLGVMVSLDGVGAVHDEVRGSPGNFESACAVLAHLRATDLSVSVGCTVSRKNVWHVDDLLHYLRANDLYGRFRVAEFIERLYNADRGEVIRSFSDDEAYHLALFFKKLELSYEKDDTYRRTYRSIHGMLSGEKRAIGCPYHTDGVVFGARGDLAYCAPKGKSLGSAVDEDAAVLYRRGREQKQRILDESCADCIHDYHAPTTFQEMKRDLWERGWRRLFREETLLGSALVRRAFSSPRQRVERPSVLVVGWYGTETVGDKAILGGLVDTYRQRLGDPRFVIASLYPFVTRRTVRELELEAEVIDAYGPDLLRWASRADHVVMGGGPLMNLDALVLPLTAFRYAKAAGRRTEVHGCGVGPLSGQPHERRVEEILRLADDVLLRDAASVDWARGRKVSARQVEDPATAYVARLGAEISTAPKSELACFFREWTTEYAGSLSRGQFLRERKRFEAGLAQLVRDEASRLGVESIRLYAMHNFVVGNDDRDFARRFLEEHFPSDPRLSFERGLSSVSSVIAAMKGARANLCMRFHSVVFAHTLGVPFRAVDYTRGGKIEAFLRDHGGLDRMVSFESLCRVS